MQLHPRFTLLLSFLLFGTVAQAQLGMGGQPHPSAALDVKATNKAFYPPRLTTAQRNAVVDPQAGALIYDTDKGTMYMHDGNSWLALSFADAGTTPLISRRASDSRPDATFGTSVAISGDYAIVAGGGNAYIFFRSSTTWLEQAKLTPTASASSASFGTNSVGIAGDYAIVGAPTENSFRGAVYIFRRSGATWTQQARLTATDAANYDYFGKSVAISGAYAIVGAPSKNSFQGAAYIFSGSGSSWSQQTQLTPADGPIRNQFGHSVGIAELYGQISYLGTRAIVGESFDFDVNNTTTISAYIFNRNTFDSFWTQQAKLTPSVAFDYTSLSVAISDKYAVLGRPGTSIGGQSQGAVYIYARPATTWTQQIALNPPYGVNSDNFGSSVSASGDYVLVGTPGRNSSQGTTFLYKNTLGVWAQSKQMTDTYSPGFPYTGRSVGLSNGLFIIGEPGYQNYTGKVLFGTVDN